MPPARVGILLVVANTVLQSAYANGHSADPRVVESEGSFFMNTVRTLLEVRAFDTD